MADGGSTQVFRQLFSFVRCDNGSASNAIYAQIFKTLAVIVKRPHKIKRPIQNNLTNESQRKI